MAGADHGLCGDLIREKVDGSECGAFLADCL